MASKLSKEQTISWLKENASHLILLEWAESASKKSKFIDTNRNVEFYCNFAIVKRNLKRNPNTIFNPTKEEMKEINKNVSIKKYGVEHYSKTKEYKERVKKTSLEKFGVENIMKSEYGKQKSKKAMKEKYGVEYPLQAEEFKKKAKETLKKRYGVEHSHQSKEIIRKVKNTWRKNYIKGHPLRDDKIKEKVKQIVLKKYGVENPRQAEEVDKKIKQTNLEKYGVEHVFQNEEIKKKIKQTNIKNGNIYMIDGKTLKEIAEEKGIGYTTAVQIHQKHGPDFLLEYEAARTCLEQIIEDFLKENNVQYLRNKGLKGTYIRPDFIIPSHNLIIECDGLYWHSDAVIEDNKHHFKRKKIYDEKGYKSLFFREDEIKKKTDIVKSIIGNKLGWSKRVYARKTKIKLVKPSIAREFFESNHLMGKGSGRTYGLYHEDELVCAIQVRWKKGQELLDISRFCPKLGCSVVGGFSKLVKHISEAEKPKQIQTFIDRRYGDGSYLKKFGFEKKTETPSFAWTDGDAAYHRMNFRGNLGYFFGMFKVYDCGQAKYVL